MAFEKLVRYQVEGSIYYGDLIETAETGFKVRRLSGGLGGFQPQGDIDTVNKLLCPLEKTPIILCIGLNYKKHATEASLEIPDYPVVFTKPSDALAGPGEAIPISPGAQSMLDYEGELVVVISKDCKNLPEDVDLSEYVLGYTAGNDVSARNYQLPKAGGGQYSYAKSFDKFAPIGPYIVSSSVIKDPQSLKYVTRVNGKTVQETDTDDMIWSVKAILRHLTRGTTVRAGTIIMTGTPAGVGFFRNLFLQDGDMVEVEIEGVMKLSNIIKYEDHASKM
ncbi:hypothetical protein P152DRAFT_473084 [Eremomyces bilateralis CBS 781.70]|uniref:Fumarylacetoacetase-like C-terminal domain-containing protein n=1 Tax=Eremomyces bilateralis CBS 781.70 TaxID=1392243 RepID=A0A6G1G650_9PEZI|nr:uncharacterized protein P152DRAFT_473084 [Eremomyces bilateralis CBS 781.70]KAF1813350.1 hypothetical protein P152DRAFT_473084 [Eremomyces bilateralis CBS 781.70]